MLNAKQARENSEKARFINFKSEIEKSIKHAISKGRFEMKIMGQIPIEIIEELQGAGYTVAQTKDMTKIIW
jgi:hypothetical protein